MQKRGSGREPLASACTASLEDRPASAVRHSRSKAVLPLPPAHIGLIGPFHARKVARGPRPRPRSIDGRRGPTLSTAPSGPLLGLRVR